MDGEDDVVCAEFILIWEGDATAIAELRSIAPYAVGTAPVPVPSILLQRKWVGHYGGAAWRRTGGEFEAAAFRLSPDYTDEDVRNAFKGQPAVTAALLPAVLAAVIAPREMIGFGWDSFSAGGT